MARAVYGIHGHRLVPVICVGVLSAAATGCMQQSAPNARMAQPAPPATTAPVILSGATLSERNPPAPSTTASISPPAAADTPDTVPVPMPEPVVASTPAPTVFAAPVPPPETRAPEPSPSLPARTADGFPNINAQPRQPTGNLLTPEERAKLISELNALAERKAGTEE